MPLEIKDLSKLCVHTMTNKAWGIKECVENYSAAGIKGISIWRNILENQDLKEVKNLLDDFQMDVVSLVRGGFFPSVSEKIRQKALDDNRLAIDQCEVIGSPILVLVCGSDSNQSLEESRRQIKNGIVSLLPQAKAAGVKLAIEPLHPMYAGDRSAVNTLCQANDMVEEINSDYVGVAVDVYHLWWDNNLQNEIMRCGSNGNLAAFHICDWNVPTTDFLNDRGIMGDGCIPISEIRGWVEEAGFEGYNEVEIFSDKYWSIDQNEYLEKIKKAYLENT